MSALLKALEDTPTHVYYVLATTDPQKLLPTIRGRCAQYTVAPLDDTTLYKLLRTVVHKEGEHLEKEVFDQIILDSQGHPRIALQILDQVLGVDPDKRLSIAIRSAELQSQTTELRGLDQGRFGATGPGEQGSSQPRIRCRSAESLPRAMKKGRM